MFASPGVFPAKASPLITHGFIRWDGFYGNTAGSPAPEEGHVFADPAWQFRAPLHAATLGADPITWADTQTTYDNEIAVAKASGIDYFAFLKYSSGTVNMGLALAYHIASTHKTDVKFCLMRQLNDCGSTGSFTTQVNDTVTYMQDTAYMKEVTGRPLLYLYANAADIVSFWSGADANFAAFVTALRAAAITAGLLNPYIIQVGPGASKSNIALWGTDAVSNYIGPTTGTVGGTYASLDAGIRAYWASGLTASNIVPITMMGWDPRPRYARPESWTPLPVGTQWTVNPTQNELTEHLKAARAYVRNNPTICPARTVLTYAWDECSEGGIMPCPTIGNPTGTIGRAVQNAKIALF